MSTSSVIPTTSPSVGGRLAVVSGFVLHAGVGVFVLASGLMMPGWAVMALAGVWVLALIAAIRHRDRPLFVLMSPIVTFAIWYLAGWAGETYLGWTA